MDIGRLAAGMVFSAGRILLGMVVRKRLPNLAGDRDVEWSWVSAEIPSGPGEALDCGAGDSFLGLVAAHRGFKVIASDLTRPQWYFAHPGIQFIQGDIRHVSLPVDGFDLVINCSMVEHVGLAGRYGVLENDIDGDLEVMTRLKELMKPGSVMLLTIPLGQDSVFPPLCRVYGIRRLPRLLEGYEVVKESFWVKSDQNQWIPALKETALSFEASAGSWTPLRNVYALGCFVLRGAGQKVRRACDSEPQSKA